MNVDNSSAGPLGHCKSLQDHVRYRMLMRQQHCVLVGEHGWRGKAASRPPQMVRSSRHSAHSKQATGIDLTLQELRAAQRHGG